MCKCTVKSQNSNHIKQNSNFFKKDFRPPKNTARQLMECCVYQEVRGNVYNGDRWFRLPKLTTCDFFIYIKKICFYLANSIMTACEMAIVYNNNVEPESPKTSLEELQDYIPFIASISWEWL